MLQTKFQNIPEKVFCDVIIFLFIKFIHNLSLQLRRQRGILKDS